MKIVKDVDEDSKVYKKAAESRGWWESGASKIYPNITSEFQFLKGICFLTSKN